MQYQYQQKENCKQNMKVNTIIQHTKITKNDNHYGKWATVTYSYKDVKAITKILKNSNIKIVFHASNIH